MLDEADPKADKQSLQLWEKQNHPLYLHHSDQPGMVLVTQILKEDNYSYWAQTMLMALTIKNKQGLINGSIPKPQDSPDERLQWERCDMLVKAWLLGAMSKEISRSVIHCADARAMWNELKERFSHTNTVQMFETERAIHKCEQGTDSVTTYFTNIKTLWDQKEALCAFPACTCAAAVEVKRYLETQKTMQFLMGLNKDYDNVRSNIVDLDTLPSVNKAYAMILRHEKQAGFSSSFKEGKDIYTTGYNKLFFSMMAFVKKKRHLLSVLPEDVVQEIFLRLPVKSILRFKCVSKSWYSFLNSLEFNAKHLSIQSEDHLFIITFTEHEPRPAAYSVSNIDDEYTYAELDMLFPYLNCTDEDPHRWCIKGPCDGLIVIADYGEGGDVVLCNIATKSFRTLPKSLFYPFPKEDHFNNKICYVGIGFDSKINDYKVLRILEIWNHNLMCRLPPRVEVFSIGTDTCWREIDVTNLNMSVSIFDQGAYADGTLFGMMHDTNIMLAFNIVDERFRYIPMPKRRCAQTNETFVPAVYNKKMAVFDVRCLNYFEGGFSIDVWVMNKFTMEECWTKVLTFRLQIPTRCFNVSFFKNDTQFVYVDANHKVRVYDLVKMETKTISLKDSDMYFAGVPYMQTLVCINNRKDVLAGTNIWP